MIIDTSVVIDRVKKKEEIFENISIITILEYPPIESYNKFYGEIYGINNEIVFIARECQKRLRKLGRMLSVGDLLILATAIYHDEKLATKDKRFYENAILIYDKVLYISQ